MKLVVCVPTASRDGYGHLSRYAEQLSKTGNEHGYEVQILRFGNPDFLPSLLTALADEDTVVHFHCFLYDLQLDFGPGGPRTRHLLDDARATVLATISDHPFSDFMQNMVRNAHPRTNFIVLEKTFPDEIRAINPKLSDARFDYQPFGPPQNFDRTLITAFGERSFDLLIPVRIVDLTGRDIDTLCANIRTPWLSDTIAATYETSIRDISRSTFHVFLEHLSTILGGASFADIRDYRPEAADCILNAMSAVDGLVQQARRHRTIRSLLRSVGDLKVAVLCDPVPGVKVDEKVQFLGQRQSPETIKLMADTRALLNCNPTYPSNLHERVTVGMLYGSCVITDVNPCIDKTFSRDEFLPYGPGYSATIADIFADYDVEAVGAAAARKIQGDRAYTWEGHFDELQRVIATSRLSPQAAVPPAAQYA